MNCLLCSADSIVFYIKEEKERGQLNYYQCQGECGLIFLDPAQRLTAEQEQERYDLHNNDPDDEGYLDFLRRATDMLVPLLPSGADGLDFGCGPGPAMQHILEPLGFKVENYDPYYYPNAELLNRKYHFIISTEVFEHLYTPAEVIEQLRAMLQPGTLLAVMTEMVNEPATVDQFEKWWYHSDPTHVSFFSARTFGWIAQQYHWTVQFPRKNVVLLQA